MVITSHYAKESPGKFIENAYTRLLDSCGRYGMGLGIDVFNVFRLTLMQVVHGLLSETALNPYNNSVK